jgi:hypothetical protein
MAKIFLLDFTEADRDHLVGKKYDVGTLSTGWATGEDEPIDLPDEAEIVFYELGDAAAPGREGLPDGFEKALAERVRQGLRVVCFVGGGETRQLTGIVGPLAGLQIKDGGRGDAVVFNPRALFHVPFERFRPHIDKAYRLLDETLAEGVWEKEAGADGKLEVLAKTADGAPVALVVRMGRGFVLVLPSFGAKTAEVVDHILKD